MAGNWMIEKGKEAFEALHVQIKIGRIDDGEDVTSTGKVLQIGEREIPMSRFGTWVFGNFEEEKDASQLLRSGGITAALTWALFKSYPEISAWVSELDDHSFVFDVTKSKKKQVLNEIGSGLMKRKIENILRQISSVDFYKNVKVKLIKILPKPGAREPKASARGNQKAWNKSGEAENLEKLEHAEQIGFLLAKQEYSLAYLRLKKDLETETDELRRFQILLRLSICAVALRNTEEAKTMCFTLLGMMKSLDISSDDVPHFQDELTMLITRLSETGPHVRTMEVILASVQLTKRIKDPKIRMDKICTAATNAAGAATLIMKLKPDVDVTRKVREYLGKVDKELIGFIRAEKSVDSLLKAQSIYYCEFALAGARSLLDGPCTFFGDSAETFKNVSGPWSDPPCVIARLRGHPIAQHYLADREFVATIEEISKDPSILPRKLSNPKILHADRILRTNFGFESGLDNDGDEKDGSLAGLDFEFGNLGASSSSLQTGGNVAAKTPKNLAEEEKKKGNDAYKKKQFDKALQHYDRAIAHDPTNAMLHSNKAAVYLEQRRFDLARQACVKAIELIRSLDADGTQHVDMAKVVGRLARIESHCNNIPLAMQLCQQSLGLHPDEKVTSLLNECKQKMFFASMMMGGMMRNGGMPGFPFNGFPG